LPLELEQAWLSRDETSHLEPGMAKSTPYGDSTADD